MIYKYSETVYLNTDNISEFKYDEDNDRYVIIMNNYNKYRLNRDEFYRLMINIRAEG